MEYDELLDRAELSVRIHDYDEAIKYVKKAIDLDDSKASLYLLLGSIYQKNSEYDKASECYRTTIDKDPKCVESYNNLGVIAKNSGDFAKAIEFFKQALNVNPDRADIYYNLGNAYKLMDNKEYAKDNFEMTLKLKPDYVSAYNNLGNILDSMEHYQYALAIYQKGLKIDLNNWKLHYNIAITFDKIGNAAEAESHYRKAIEVNPTCIEAYNNLGILLEKLGSYDAAKKCYQDLLSFNPDFAKAHNNLGRIYEYLGCTDDALEEYDKAMEIEPEYRTALNNASRLYCEQHRFDKAQMPAERLVSLEPDSYDARLRLAIIKEETAPSEALPMFEQLIDRNERPDNLSMLHRHIADTYSKLDMTEEALEHYNIVRQLSANDTDNIMRIAKLNEKIGLLHEAIDILEEARQHDRDNPTLMEYLGEAYMQSGENDKAVEAMKHLQEIAPDKKNIYNMAKAAKAAGHCEEAMQYMEQLLSSTGDESLLDLSDLEGVLQMYEDMVAELSSQNVQANQNVLDIAHDYTMEELLADAADEEVTVDTDALSELEQSLIAETDNGKLISFGDNAPVYDVEEEEEILDATDAKEPPQESIFNLLRDNSYTDESYDPNDYLPEPPPQPKVPNPYEGLPPPTINLTTENSADDNRLERLENAILQLTEQIVNLMRGNPEVYGGLPLADENDMLKSQIAELTKRLESGEGTAGPDFAGSDEPDSKIDDDYEVSESQASVHTGDEQTHSEDSEDDSSADEDSESSDNARDTNEVSITEEDDIDEYESDDDEDEPVKQHDSKKPKQKSKKNHRTDESDNALISDEGEETIVSEEDDDIDDYDDDDDDDIDYDGDKHHADKKSHHGKSHSENETDSDENHQTDKSHPDKNDDTHRLDENVTYVIPNASINAESVMVRDDGDEIIVSEEEDDDTPYEDKPAPTETPTQSSDVSQDSSADAVTVSAEEDDEPAAVGAEPVVEADGDEPIPAASDTAPSPQNETGSATLTVNGNVNVIPGTAAAIPSDGVSQQVGMPSSLDAMSNAPIDPGVGYDTLSGYAAPIQSLDGYPTDDAVSKIPYPTDGELVPPPIYDDTGYEQGHSESIPRNVMPNLSNQSPVRQPMPHYQHRPSRRPRIKTITINNVIIDIIE